MDVFAFSGSLRRIDWHLCFVLHSGRRSFAFYPLPGHGTVSGCSFKGTIDGTQRRSLFANDMASRLGCLVQLRSFGNAFISGNHRCRSVRNVAQRISIRPNHAAEYVDSTGFLRPFSVRFCWTCRVSVHLWIYERQI